MANIPIKYRTAKNFRHNQYDFSVTSSKGNLEVNFFICSAFYSSAPAFYPSVPAFCPTALLLIIPYLKRNLFLFKI